MTCITKRHRRSLFLKTAFSPGLSHVPAFRDVFKWSSKDREGRETMGQKVTVLALFKAKPGLEEEVKRELMALQGPTRSEEGCINYDLHQSKDDPSRFMFYENWQSRELWQVHMATQHLQDYMTATEGAVEEFTLNEMTHIA